MHNPATVQLDVGMYLHLAALDTIWLENLFILVSRWATNLKLNLCNTACAELDTPAERVKAEHAPGDSQTSPQAVPAPTSLHERSKPRPLA